MTTTAQTSSAPSRRTMVKGAAWAVPAVALTSTAPALAASPRCTPTVSTWQSGGTVNGASVNWVVNSPTKIRLLGENKQLMSVNNGIYPGERWIGLDQYGDNRNGQTVTVTFPSDVYCLEFYITDIDALSTAPLLKTDNYRDRVTVTANTPLTATALSPADVSISGSGSTSVAAYTPHPADTSGAYQWNNLTSTRGTVRFAATGPLRTFTLTYTNPGWENGTSFNDQQVYLSNLHYSTTECLC